MTKKLLPRVPSAISSLNWPRNWRHVKSWLIGTWPVLFFGAKINANRPVRLLCYRAHPDAGRRGLAEVDYFIADGQRHRFVIFAAADPSAGSGVKREA